MHGLIEKLSIRGRILLLAVGLMFSTVVVSAYALFAIGEIGLELEGVAERDVPMTKALSEVTMHQLEQAIHFERALRLGELKRTDASLTQSFEKELQAFRKFDEKATQELARLSTDLNDMVVRFRFA